MKNLQALLNKLYLPGLFKSKRFWFTFFGWIATVVAYYQPGFEPYMPQAIAAITAVVVAYVSGQSLKDIATIFMEAWSSVKLEDNPDV